MACSISGDFEDFLQDGERDVETDVSSADEEDVSCDEEAGFDLEQGKYRCSFTWQTCSSGLSERFELN